MRRESLLLIVAVSLVASCGKRVPEPAAVTPGMPHISWIIMSGDSDNPDREFVCQSEPRTECLVAASRADEKVFSDVHVYYHGAGTETKYTGSFQVGFFEGSLTGRTLKTDIAVRKVEGIANQSVTNIVTSTPGTYAVDFTLVAAVTDNRKTQSIIEKVTVVVR